MIVSNGNISYDMTGRYYYLTETGLKNLTLVKEGAWGDSTLQRSKMQGEQVHEEYIKSAYTASERCSHKDLMEYKVFKNAYGEVSAIQRALINYANLADYNNADFTYMETGVMPRNVITPLINANLYIQGRLSGIVPEAEYQVGY